MRHLSSDFARIRFEISTTQFEISRRCVSANRRQAAVDLSFSRLFVYTVSLHFSLKFLEGFINHNRLIRSVTSSLVRILSRMSSKYVNSNNTKIGGKEDASTSSECICYRPHSNIICNGCGYWTRGRVRYYCSQHPKIVFLHDHTQCPRCKSYDFMLTEM